MHFKRVAYLWQLLAELVELLLQWSFICFSLGHFRSDLAWKKRNQTDPSNIVDVKTYKYTTNSGAVNTKTLNTKQ